MIRCSVIYVNFHSSELIRNSIESFRTFHGSASIEYLIASNSSEDLADIADWAARMDVPIRVIPMSGNRGFASANNAAAAQARGEFLLFLNPDTLVRMSVLDGLERAWKAMSDPGMVGPLTRYEDGTPQRTVRDRYHPRHILEYLVPVLSRWFAGFPNHRVPDRSCPVPVVNGSAMFMHRDVFRGIGGMEERYFLYWEEDDLCIKLHKQGKTIWFERDVEIIHLESRVAKRINLDLQRIRYESKYAYLQIHHPEWVLTDLVMSIPIFTLRLLISMAALSSFRIRLNHMLLRWHVGALIRALSGR
jgi:GT2 family glycosyltransferase